MAKTTETQERGSQLMVERVFGDNAALSEESLSQMVKVTKRRGVQLLHWWVRGQPRPDLIKGALQVTPSAVGPVISDLIRMDQVRFRLDVFPYGIPNIDRFLVRFENISELPGGQR